MRRSTPVVPVFLAVGAITLAAVVSVYLLGLRVAWANGDLMQIQDARAHVQDLMSLVKDAETGQRGFLITGEEPYLSPYLEAKKQIPEQMSVVEADVAEGWTPREMMPSLRDLIERKLQELDRTIETRRTAGLAPAIARVHTDEGQRLMNGVRDVVAAIDQQMGEHESALTARRDKATFLRTGITWLASAMTLTFVFWAYMQVRSYTRRQEAASRSVEESGQRLDGIVSSAMDAIISIDEHQKILLFNTAAEQVFRCAASDAIGSDLGRFIPERFRNLHHEHVRHFATTGQTRRAMGGPGLTLSGLRSNGEEFPIDASISQVVVGGQRILTVVLRDVTERRKAEEAIKASAERLSELNATLERRVQERTSELAEANKELEAFGYTVSHDLRAPLRHVTSFVELLGRHAGASLDEKGQRYLKTIADAGRKMGNLIDDLLTLSRVGRATVSLVDVSLRQLFQEALVQLTPEMAGRVIDWRIHDLPHVQADPSLMRSVIVNLLSNAIKYTRTRASAVIEVGSRRENGQVICYVKDNGVGFDMRFADKLFGVFQRLHRLEEFEGTGVGLASVRRVVLKHGGSVWAEGELDKGATFYFSLPASVEAEGP